MMRVLAAAAFSLAAAACASNGDDGGAIADSGAPAPIRAIDAAPPPAIDASVATVIASTVTVDTKVRTYETVVPSGYAAASPRLPLVVVFHGDHGTGAEIRSDAPIEAAAGGGAIFLYPDAVGSELAWDIDDPDGVNPDIAFFDAMLQATAGAYPYDTNRVFVAGFSRGAFFANQIGCSRGGVVRALASYEGGGPFALSGNGQYDGNGQLICGGTAQQVGAFIVQGDADENVPLDKGQQSLAHWSYEAGCSAMASSEEPVAPSPCVTWNGCSPPVVWCEIPLLAHAIWPSAPAATWSFFETFK